MTDDETEPDQHRWDLSVLFSGWREWDSACDRYERRVESLTSDETAVAEPDALAANLERRDELLEVGSRLGVYAFCRTWNDATDEAARERRQRVERLAARRDAALRELESALRSVGRDRVDDLVASTDGLEVYAHYLDDVFRRGAYALEPPAERVVGELEESLDAPARTLRTVRDRAFEPPTVTDPDGQDVRLTKPARKAALTDPDRAYRRRVYEAYREALCEHREVAAGAYVDHVRSHDARADVRDYESLLAGSLDGLVSPAAVDSLVDRLRGTGGPFRRRYDLLRDRRGLDDLRPWDMRAPVADESAPEIPYDEAVDVALAAVEPLGEPYQERLAGFLDDRRVDVYPAAGKRDVPAVMFGENGTEAFVHLTYDGTLESLYLFVHELGHVMHYLLARDAQPPAYRRLSWHVGELPSFLHEVLLTRHLLETDRVPDGAVLDTVLGRVSPLAPARGVAFTRRLAEAIDAGDRPTADEIDEYWRETGGEFFDSLTFTEDDGHRWLNLNLDRDPYHAVWYLLGRTGALATASRLDDGDLSAERYRQFLAAGDSAYPMDLLDDLGLDLGSGGVADAAERTYADLLDAL